MRILFICFALLSLITPQKGFSQKLNEHLKGLEITDYNKLYLHVDREFYFLGDTLWFNAYYLDGNTNRVLSSQANLHVELIAQEGSVCNKELFSIQDGTAKGYLILDNPKIKEGNYLFRAYTDYLKNFGDDAFFEKCINISGVKSSIELASKSEKEVLQERDVDLQLLPEGGFILPNIPNRIAFKAIDSKGSGVDITGEIIDEDGNVLMNFVSAYKGMGEFFFKPEKGKSYRVRHNYKPEKSFTLIDGNIQLSGTKLCLVNSSPKNLVLRIDSNIEPSEEDYHIVGLNRGQAIFHVKVDPKRINNLLKINTKNLEGGINRLVLFDNDFNPLSERLIFSKAYSNVDLKLISNKEHFMTRESVQIGIATANGHRLSDEAKLSMSIVDENTLNSEGITQNIMSFLLLDSELKGHVESPLNYFVDDDNIRSKAKLDLLMLTNGWSNYIWNRRGDFSTEMIYQDEQGISIQGSVKKSIGRKYESLTNVVLGVFGDENNLFFDTKTDLNGNFKFDNLFISDSLSVFVQGLDKKNRAITRLNLDTPIVTQFKLDESRLSFVNGMDAIPNSLLKQRYYAELSLKEFFPDRDSRLLPEIRIETTVPKWREDDGHHRLYGQPDVSMKLTDTDMFAQNVIEYLKGRVAGMYIVGDKITIRGQVSLSKDVSTDPLVLVDGVAADIGYLKIIPMTDIDKIEVLKSAAKSAIYGSRGANGVISILTKRGTDELPKNHYSLLSTARKRIKGFSLFREFYSPQYTANTINSQVPDHRTTLYWNPEIDVVKGDTKVNFYTSDDIGYFYVVVEGITPEGEICFGTTRFSVDEVNNLLGDR